jgi:hypothetical protein
MRIKAIVLALLLSLVLFTGFAFADLATFTDAVNSIRVDQLTYGAAPVWKVTNFSSVSKVVRFVQPSGFTATLFLASGESTSLGNFERFHEWSCNAGSMPFVYATGSQPTFADETAGNTVNCKSN